MKLEVGEFYLNASGEIVKIDAIYGNNMFEDASGNIYEQDGIIFDGKESNDLIADIPKQLHYELLRVVNEYHTNKEFKSMIDINFDKRKIK